MSTPDPIPPAAPSGQPTDGFFDSVRRTGLFRANDRWIGGVGAGLARRLGVDPLVVRGLLLVSVLLGGLGLALYAVAWVLLPEESDGRIHLQEIFRGHADIAVLGAAVLLVSGLTMTSGLTPGWYLGDSDWWRGLVWLGVIVTVVALIVSRRRPRDPRPAPGPTTTLRPGQVATTTSAAAPEGPFMSTTPMAPVPPRPGSAASAGPQQSWSAPAGGQQQGWTPPPAWGPAVAGQPGRPSGPTTALPPQAPRAPRGAGAGTFGIVVALTLIVLAGLLYADRLGALAAPVGLTTLAAAVILLGAAIAVAGLRGRTAGGLSVLAVVLALTAAPIAANHLYDWPRGNGSQVAFGELVERPLTVTEAERGYTLGIGDARIDLTGLPEGSGEVWVPIDAAVGDVTVIVPRGASVSAEITVGAGDVTWFDETSSFDPAGDGRSTVLRSREGDSTGTELSLFISLGLGSLTVEESGR
ncbi:PspC domain-containing protein [Actinotalea sp.]|uniref:PspC domain-containing protein n=1 Tax=Actinotalea sp. TaxID=1872145 RepID=UPI0035657C17